MHLVSKIFNLCGHDPPTSQSDRRTDGQTNRRHVIAIPHYSASCGKNQGVIAFLETRCSCCNCTYLTICTGRNAVQEAEEKNADLLKFPDQLERLKEAVE